MRISFHFINVTFVLLLHIENLLIQILNLLVYNFCLQNLLSLSQTFFSQKPVVNLVLYLTLLWTYIEVCFPNNKNHTRQKKTSTMFVQIIRKINAVGYLFFFLEKEKPNKKIYRVFYSFDVIVCNKNYLYAWAVLDRYSTYDGLIILQF